MPPNDFSLSPNAFAAHLLDGVMDVTAPPNEAPEAAAMRQASIVEMFRAFQPSDAVEAMVACHCIALTFVSRGALRDACDTGLDPKGLARARAQATAISRTLQIWMTKFETMKARNEKRAAAAGTEGPSARTAAPPPAAAPPDARPPAGQPSPPPSSPPPSSRPPSSRPPSPEPRPPVPPSPAPAPSVPPDEPRPFFVRPAAAVPAHPDLAMLAAKDALTAGRKPNGHGGGPAERSNL